MKVQDLLDMGYENFIVFDYPSYEGCIMGISTDNKAVYSYEKMIAYLMETQGMNETDAIEFCDTNTISSLNNYSTPIVVFTEG